MALACEATFTLLAVPILGRLGPGGVSIHTSWIAALQLAVVAVVVDGSAAVPVPTGREAFAVVYLAVVLTAVAFVLWYRAVLRIGPATAGLFPGLVPLSAGLSGVFLGLTTLTTGVFVGAALVGAGIVIGLTSPNPAADVADSEQREPDHPDLVSTSA